ncbi:integrase core domain-containing protein [Candidatus Poriferisodalis sp.]|uniref:integrase core domain-containing protein n=1 Tax=Candidatus Poriferisodalis sp. TaxID=3101277 RepID=UPI003B5BC361
MKRPSRQVLSRVALAVVSAATLMPIDSAGAQTVVDTDAGVSNIEQASAGAVEMSGSTTTPEILKQPFITGSNTGGYQISSVAMALGSIGDPLPGQTPELHLRMRILDSQTTNGKVEPDSPICGKLTPPTFEADAVNTWTTNQTCSLNPDSTYFVELKYMTTNQQPSTRPVELKYMTAAEVPDSGDFEFDTSHADSPVDYAQLDDQSAADWKIPLVHKQVANNGNLTPIADQALLIDVNDVNDVTVAGLIIDPTELDIEEGDSASYTVKLAAAPAGDVTVTIGGHDNTDATLSGSGLTGSDLTFTTSNWNNLQTVTVTAEEDGDNDDEAAIDLTHTATSTGDTNYDNLTGSTVTVSIEDDDEAGLIIEPTDLAITEGEVAVPDGNIYLVPTGYTYTVKLATEPEADVDVEVTGHAGTSAVLTGVTNDTLTFTPSNWDMAQTVVVTADEDDDDDDETVTLSHEASSTGDNDYEGLTGSDVTVTITDNDEAGLIFDIDPLELTVDEEDSASYTVRLASKPQTAVVVVLTGQSGSDVSLMGDVQTNTLNFTPDDWNTPKTITVVADHDDDGRNDIFDLNHSTAGLDPGYDLVEVVQVEITVTDNDPAGLIFSLNALVLAVTEEMPASYTVQLATEPQATVFVLLGSDPVTSLTMLGDVVGFTLTFEPDEWDTPQTVTFEVDHDDDGRDGSFDLVHSITSNGDSDYNGVGDPEITVTVDDDDNPDVIVDHTEITAVEGSFQNFTVRLATEPSDAVTVTISGHSGTDASLSGSDVSSDALSFDANNWDTPQTVTVDADEDVDTTEDEVFLRYTATSTDDTEYHNLTDDLVKVTITDNDSPGLAINPPAINVDEGASASYTVELGTQPATDVTVTVTVPANSGASLSGGALTRDLTFNSGNWNVPQTVTVTAHEDDDARNGAVDISHSSSGADYVNLIISDVGVTILDDDEAELVIDPTAIDVEEEGSASYTVRLATAPSAGVTVDIDGHGGTDASLSGSDVSNDALTFTTGNWDTPQTVTVAAADDGDNDDEAPVNLTHTAFSSDNQYNNLAGDPVRVTITDNDDVGIVGSDTAVVLVSTDSFELVEGGSGDYTITLGRLPTEDVTISIIGNTGSDVSVTGNTLSNDVTLTFTAANWSTEQTVTVTANQDDDAIDEIDVTLIHVAESADSAYNGISVDSITVAVDDDDTAGVTVSATELSVTEGSSNTYEVSLSSQPREDVTVTIAGHDGSDLTLGGGALNSDYGLTFTAANWSTAQIVTVTAAEDDDAGTDLPVELTHTAVSGDPDYDGISVDSVTAAITEKDAAAITVKDTAATTEMDTELDVPEIGTGTYTVTLSHPPTSDVTIDITVSCDTESCEVTTNPTQLVFTPDNGTAPQTVTVIAGNDDDAISDGATITHAIAPGSADEYALVVVADVIVNVTDNDTAGLSVSPAVPAVPAVIGIVEEGTGTFTVVLTSEPSDDVTVAVTSADPAIATVTEGASLTFTATNWNTAQTVTVSGTDDADTDNGTVIVTANASSTDADYQGDTAQVTVAVTDNDTDAVVLSVPLLTVTEGETGTYTLSLARAPTADVTIGIAATGGVTVNDDATASVTFTPSNWQQPRQVTVAAAEDDDEVNDTATITHDIAPGSAAEYDNISIGDVKVAISDNDGPGLKIHSEALAVTNRGTTTYTVSLNSAPDPGVTQNSLSPQFQVPEVRAPGDPPGSSTDVVVRIYAGGGLSVEPDSLTFPADDWDTPQQVLVSGNSAVTGSRFTIVHVIEGPGNYATIPNEGLDLTVTQSSSGGSSSSSSCGASDFARRDPGSFRLHLRWLLALIMEAVNDDIDTAEAEADADSRAEVRLVAGDADGADLPGRRRSRGWGGSVGDHPAASGCPRWSDRGAGGVEAGPAASVSPGGVGGRGVAGRGRPAPGDGGRAGRRVGGAAGKIAPGMSGPVPARVDGTAKAALLSLIDDAVNAGWTLNRACAVVELDRGRAWRWQQRRAGGGLDDARPGGNPIHGLLEWEEAEILALFDEWGDVDRSHRKLAHRGSYEQRVWASPSTVDRVLARHGLALQGAPRPARTVKTPWPHWCEWHPNQLWCWDGSQFERCVAAKHAYAIVDLVSRKRISTRLTANPDSVAARVLFSRGLDNEGLLTDELRARLTDPDTALPDGDQAPLLLAVSDNGTEMHANETRRFMALCSIAQHFGRPSTPTDQAWIESLWGHVKREHPHLTTITDPAVLAAELERVRVHHNSVRLHEAIGYVTPNDEHHGRGDTIRAARTHGMRNADEQRRAWHRSQR